MRPQIPHAHPCAMDQSVDDLDPRAHSRPDGRAARIAVSAQRDLRARQADRARPVRAPAVLLSAQDDQRRPRRHRRRRGDGARPSAQQLRAARHARLGQALLSVARGHAGRDARGRAAGARIPRPATEVAGKVGWAKRSVPTVRRLILLDPTWARRYAPLPTLRFADNYFGSVAWIAFQSKRLASPNASSSPTPLKPTLKIALGPSATTTVPDLSATWKVRASVKPSTVAVDMCISAVSSFIPDWIAPTIP